MMDKVKLEMDFLDEANKTVRVTLDDPKEDITPEEIETAMESIINLGTLSSKEGDIVGVGKARIVTTNVDEITF